MVRKNIFLLILCVVSGCASLSPRQEVQPAEEAAMEFFNLLSQEKYAEAGRLFGGDYSSLISMNPEIPENDHAALWKNGCEFNGLQCLPILRVVGAEKFSLNEFFLTVEFKNADGSLFVQGPCCGATEEEMPPVSQFDIHVIEQSGNYLVTSLPVFTP